MKRGLTAILVAIALSAASCDFVEDQSRNLAVGMARTAVQAALRANGNGGARPGDTPLTKPSSATSNHDPAQCPLERARLACLESARARKSAKPAPAPASKSAQIVSVDLAIDRGAVAERLRAAQGERRVRLVLAHESWPAAFTPVSSRPCRIQPRVAGAS